MYLWLKMFHLKGEYIIVKAIYSIRRLLKMKIVENLNIDLSPTLSRMKESLVTFNNI